jgi:uncharacterized delta-60 repeat protein
MTRSAQKLCVCQFIGFFLLFILLEPASGQVSILDSSFKIGPGTDGPVNALLVQQDQRILIGGEFGTISGISNSYLARLNADGSLDDSFNPPGQTDGNVFCMAKQQDQKILIGGDFNQILGTERHGLVRLLQDGSIDPAFNANAFFPSDTIVFALALQSDGKILAAYYPGRDYSSGRIGRFDTNGLPDPTWISTNVFGGYLLSLIPLPDGSILVGGSPGGVQPDLGINLFRLQANGQFDQSFNPGLDTSNVFCLLRKPSVVLQ